MGQFFSKDTESNESMIKVLNSYEALESAERIDGYRKRVQTNRYNAIARANQIYAPVNKNPDRHIPETGPWENGIVVWMNNSADGGLPHTRPPNYVCIPSSFPEAALKKTLLHERIHLSQRKYPKEWIKLIMAAWGMNVWSGVIPIHLENRRRINPDLLLAPHFLWKNTYLPLCIFADLANASLTNTRIVWFNIQTRTVISKLNDWSVFFGKDIKDDEHPWEIAAYILSDMSIVCPASKLLNKEIATGQYILF
jgi:hypothetical protein